MIANETTFHKRPNDRNLHLKVTVRPSTISTLTEYNEINLYKEMSEFLKLNALKLI